MNKLIQTKEKLNPKVRIHIYDYPKARSVKDCYRIAKSDASDLEEEGYNWLTCLQGVFAGTHKISYKGHLAKFIDITFNRAILVKVPIAVAFIETTDILKRVELDSIDWIRPTNLQKLWLRSYRKWLNENVYGGDLN